MADRIPLVLGPGLMCDDDLWWHQILHLREVAEITIVDTLQDDSLAGMARRLLAAAPDRFAYAGLSMGGYLAFEIMRQAPGRVSRLALLDTSARADTPERAEGRRRLIAMARDGRFEECLLAQMPVFLHPDSADDVADPLRRRIAAMARRVGPRVYAAQLQAIMGRPDSREDLAGIAVPTIVVCGRQDLGTPLEVNAEIARGIPRARLCVVEDCGHMATMEQPVAVTALLRDWLTRDQ